MPPKGKKRGPKPGNKKSTNATVVKVCLDTNLPQSLNNLTNVEAGESHSQSMSNSYIEDRSSVNDGPTNFVISQPQLSNDDSSYESSKKISSNKRRRGRPSSKAKNNLEVPIKRGRKKLKRDTSDDDLNDSEMMDFEEDNMYMNSDNEYDSNPERGNNNNKEYDSDVLEEEEGDSYSDFEDEEKFLTSNRNKKLSMMQSTTYQSKRLTSRQKAVLKKNNLNNTDDEQIDNVNDELYNESENIPDENVYEQTPVEEPKPTGSLQNSNLKVTIPQNPSQNPSQPPHYTGGRETRGNKKKKKNILTQEEKTKKLEIEEKRRAHQAKLNEDHKQQIVNKILNENKRNKTGMLTDHAKKLQNRQVILKNRRFQADEVITKHRYDIGENLLHLPRGQSFKALLNEDYDSYFENRKRYRDSPSRKVSVGSNSHGNLILLRKNSQSSPRKTPRKDSVDTKPEQILQDFTELKTEWPMTCCVSNCEKARKYKLPVSNKKDINHKKQSACSFECFKKLKAAPITSNSKNTSIVC